MRYFATAIALLTLAACGDTETGFQQGTDNNATEEGGGVLEFFPTELVWTDLEVGVTASQYAKITSVGTEPLSVYEIGVVSSADGQFTVEDIESFDLQPDGEREFTVQCTLTAEALVEGELRVRSNDADQTDLRISLTATPVGYTEPEDTGGDTGGDTGMGG